MIINFSMIINIFNSKYKILDLDAKKNMGTSNLRKYFEKNHEKIVLKGLGFSLNP